MRRRELLGGPGGRRQLVRRQPVASPDPLAHAIDRGGEAVGAERLQQVVDGVHVEGADGVLIERGHEHDGHVAADQLQHLEAVELRHLHVEDQQVRPQVRHGLHRFESVRALGDDVDAGHARQVLADHGARQLLVVHDGHFQARHGASVIRTCSG